jgi:hypothetical protein
MSRRKIATIARIFQDFFAVDGVCSAAARIRMEFCGDPAGYVEACRADLHKRRSGKRKPLNSCTSTFYALL